MRKGGLDDPACLVEPSVRERVERTVEHKRDPGELLHRSVVEEQRKPAPLVLLCGDQPLERIVALHVCG
jgi:hypothetical protein